MELKNRRGKKPVSYTHLDVYKRQVSACVVIAIGLSLLSVGMDSWGGGNGAEDFGAWYHLLVGFFTLVVCLAARYLLKGVYKNLNVLVGLVCGYLLSIIFTVAGIAPMVDFSGITKTIEQVGVFLSLIHIYYGYARISAKYF